MALKHQTALPEPTIALLSWGNVIEDFLDPLGVTLEDFCNEFRGSWMFGYIDALRSVGVRTVLVCMSTRVTVPSRFAHVPTGATICVLPAPKIYRAIRHHMVYPYGRTVKETFGNLRGARRILLPLYAVLREVVLYLTTPLTLLAKELHSQGCMAILCQEYEYPRFDTVVVLGKAMHLPVFATFQGGNYHHSRLERFVRPYTMRACAGLIIATQTEIQRVRTRYKVPPVKLAQIFNPLDINLWRATDKAEARAALGIPLDARVVAWHARVSLHKKGLDILLEAWERICRMRSDKDLRLLLVGTGDDAGDLQQRLTSMQLRGVLWTNRFVHDPAVIRRCLSASDVYAFASRYEGFPVAPLEAMACGLPLVATDVEGIPDILDGGAASGGLVVPSSNATELASALGRVLDDQDWACELGQRARRRVEACFSLEAVGRQLRAFLLPGLAEH
jgi:glycosyltransferase involved in cell wall biosynthesis